MIDPVALTQALIRCPSVTPAEGGALDLLQGVLAPLGYDCHRLRFSAPDTPDIDNLYAVAGGSGGADGRHFCFAGHSDVVPVGRAESWSVDPFGGAILNGKLFGRGAADMKGAIAAFIAAAEQFRAGPQGSAGRISLLITGDEEGPAVNGTVKMLDWLAARGDIPDACLVGEPTNPARLGEMAKIGRRGSFNGFLTVTGIQGHVAYPDRADNPVPKLVRLLAALDATRLDDGSASFQPSNLEIVTIDVGNGATNVIPNQARATFNIRFNDHFSGASLEALLRARLDATGIPYDLRVAVSGESFLCPPGPLSELLDQACRAELGRSPELSTSGGTSDARFIQRYCPLIEFGLVGQTMHQVDEHAAVADIETLTRIYHRMLAGFFGG